MVTTNHMLMPEKLWTDECVVGEVEESFQCYQYGGCEVETVKFLLHWRVSHLGTQYHDNRANTEGFCCPESVSALFFLYSMIMVVYSVNCMQMDFFICTC